MMKPLDLYLFSIWIVIIGLGLFAYLDSQVKPPLRQVPNQVYDYIVVGAGSAGCVVASRLSEDPKVKVLLVEAGGDDRADHRVRFPTVSGQLLDNAWDMYAARTTMSSGPPRPTSTRNQVPLRSGMILGGSSSVNFQVYARGSRHDFNLWASLTGDKKWDYEHVLPYFKKSEGMVDKPLRNSRYHGRNGTLAVSTYKSGGKIYRTIVDAFKELGFPFNEDYNGEFMEGVAYTQYNTFEGERVSSSRAFIHPFIKRRNLHVSVDSFVQRVLIRDKTARGIEMVQRNRKYKIKARKEVILSAGAIQSPKILMLSGIGPRNVLTKHRIPVIEDLPVGQNLQNHPMTEVPIAVTSSVTGTSKPVSRVRSYFWYVLLSLGYYASSDIDVLFHTTVTDSETKDDDDDDWPDLQLMFIGKPINSNFMKDFKFHQSIIDDLGKERDAHKHGFGCFPAVMRPESRGHVRIKSSDPFDLPFVLLNHLDSKRDTDLLIRGVRLCQSLVNTKAMDAVGAFLADSKPMRLCKEHSFDSDDYWACTFEKKPLTHYHPAGTCKMGSSDDPTAVLDSSLRVKGIKGLRVADASVMPTIVSANPHAAIVMIGEMAADMILGCL